MKILVVTDMSKHWGIVHIHPSNLRHEVMKWWGHTMWLLFLRKISKGLKILFGRYSP
ncbi:MAG: hypothetical protein KKF93_07515 [Candidatus Omnitrophica bacterium]|nr:hypothetical protein [Candidatus Omnitrophota bacterium]